MRRAWAGRHFHKKESVISYNGSGTFQINTAGQPVVTGTTITSTAFNLLTADLATGLSTAVTKDGQTTTTAAIPFALGITMSGTASNIALGSNFISNGGTDAGLSLDASNNATLSANLSVNGNAALGDASTDSHTVLGAFSITDDGAALVLSREGGGDRVFFTPQAAGSGLLIEVENSGLTDYEPITIIGETVTLKYRSGALASTNGLVIDTAGLVTMAGGISVAGAGIVCATTGAVTPMVVGESGVSQIIIGNGGGSANFMDADTQTFRGGSGTTRFVISNTAGASRIVDGMRIGADSTNNLLDDATNGAGTATLFIGNASINVTSDGRLKSNIVPLEYGLETVMRLKPVEFDQEELRPYGCHTHYVGFIAQDLNEVAPWAVNTQGDTGLPWQARYEFLMAPVVRAIQELNDRISAMEG